MGCTIRLSDHRKTYVYGGPRLRINVVRLLISAAADPYLNNPSLCPVWIQSDDAPLQIICRHSKIVYDLLHAAVGVVQGREEVVEGSDVMVNNASFFKIEFN